jgi:AcrR family transcriptional regulator
VTNTRSPALIDRVAAEFTEDSLEDRILGATLRCMARWGVAKTTIDDIAREAGCSRATIYRAFPGGKDALVAATWSSQAGAFFIALAAEIDRQDSLEDALVVGLTESSRAIASHEALHYLVEHEPGVILPYLSFDGIDPLLDWASEFAVPCFARFTDAESARHLGEWMARILVSYNFGPSSSSDFTDPAETRRFLSTFVLPGLAGLAELAGLAVPGDLPVGSDASDASEPSVELIRETNNPPPRGAAFAQRSTP